MNTIITTDGTTGVARTGLPAAGKTQVRIGWNSSILFAVYFGSIAWGGLYLRDERLRGLFPFRR
jgi:hypothetical protein